MADTVVVQVSEIRARIVEIIRATANVETVYSGDLDEYTEFANPHEVADAILAEFIVKPRSDK